MDAFNINNRSIPAALYRNLGFLLHNDGDGMSFHAADGTFSPHDESLNPLLFNLQHQEELARL